MSDLAILNRQIADQVEGRTIIEVNFLDAKPEFLYLYNQDKYHIQPLFCMDKIISEEIYKELINKCSEEQYCNEDYFFHYRTLTSNMTYDDFFNNYYNKFSKK